MVPDIKLKCDEYIKYTATYGKEDIRLQPGSNDVFGYLSIVVHLSVNTENVNVFNVSYFNSDTDTSSSLIVSTYNANLLSLDEKNLSIGTLELSNTGVGGGSGGISPPAIQEYTVLGGNGIYKKITRVVADFRQDIRVFYFLARHY
jgi:hypothetical protein